MYQLGRSDRIKATGTLILSGIALAARSDGKARTARASTYREIACKFVAVEFDFLNVVLQNPVNQFVGDLGACIAPSVFFGTCADKHMGFCNFLEGLVVVNPSVRCVLNMENRIGKHMTALVNDCSQSQFDRSVKRSCSNIDFPASLSLDIPCVVERIATVCPRRRLNGDNRLGKFIVEQVSIYHAEDFFRDFRRGERS